jgi:hypothetical protein
MSIDYTLVKAKLYNELIEHGNLETARANSGLTEDSAFQAAGSDDPQSFMNTIMACIAEYGENQVLKSHAARLEENKTFFDQKRAEHPEHVEEIDQAQVHALRDLEALKNKGIADVQAVIRGVSSVSPA